MSGVRGRRVLAGEPPRPPPGIQGRPKVSGPVVRGDAEAQETAPTLVASRELSYSGKHVAVMRSPEESAMLACAENLIKPLNSALAVGNKQKPGCVGKLHAHMHSHSSQSRIFSCTMKMECGNRYTCREFWTLSQKSRRYLTIRLPHGVSSGKVNHAYFMFAVMAA